MRFYGFLGVSCEVYEGFWGFFERSMRVFGGFLRGLWGFLGVF